MDTSYKLYNDIGSGESKDLLEAVINNDCKYIVNYYENNNDLNKIDERGENILHKAARFKHIEVVDLLIKLGVDYNLKDLRGNSPLHIAIQFNNKMIVDRLIEEKVDINSLNLKQASPLIVASSFGYDDIIATLLEHGAKINHKDENGMSAIHYGAKSGNINILKTLLNWGAKLTSVDNRGNNVLHHACLYNNYDLIEYLLKNITVTNNVNKYGETALHIASLNCNAKVIKLLLDNGFNPRIKDLEDNRPIDIAKEYRKSEVEELFLDYTNSKEFKDHFIAYSLHQEVIEQNYQFISEKVNSKIVNDFDYFGRSPLYYAICLNDFRMVDLLYRKGAKINNLDYFNQSALLLSIYFENIEMVKFFISKGANPKEVFNEKTVCEIAKDTLNTEIVELLNQYNK